jgi:hypothetical protein
MATSTNELEALRASCFRDNRRGLNSVGCKVLERLSQQIENLPRSTAALAVAAVKILNVTRPMTYCRWLPWK